jgi:phage protein U
MVDERTPRDKQLLDDIVDGHLSPLAFFAALQAFAGTRKMLEMVGYACLWGVLGVESIQEMRKRYEDAGLSQRAAYRCATDFRRFGDYLLQEFGREVEMKQILRGCRGLVQ